MGKHSNYTYKVANYSIAPSLNRITLEERVIKVEPRTMDLLVYLIKHEGEVVAKQQIFDKVWNETFVTEDSLFKSISDLRKIFGDTSKDPRFIETIHKVGYRFVGPVNVVRSRENKFSNVLHSKSPLLIASVILLAIVATLVYGNFVNNSPAFEKSGSLPIHVTSFMGIEFDPTISPDGRSMAFTWSGYENDNLDIYIKNLEASNPIRLTYSKSLDCNPEWSPDGNSLVFYRVDSVRSSIRQVLFPSADSEELIELHTPVESNLSYSPDGKIVAFADKRDTGPFRIYALNVATRKIETLTDPPSENYGDFSPRFSKNGNELIFVRGIIESTHSKSMSPGLGDIYLKNITTNVETRLTFDDQEITGIEWVGKEEIVFTSNRLTGNFGVWLLDLKSDQIKLLQASEDVLRDPVVKSSDILYEQWSGKMNLKIVKNFGANSGIDNDVVSSTQWDYNPDLSVNGKDLVFISNRTGNSELWLTNIDDQRPTQLTTSGERRVSSPVWSPDGKKIAFEIWTKGNSDIHALDSHTKETDTIAKTQSNEMAPTWSLDGNWIYFASNQTGDWQIWKTALAGDSTQQITTNGGFRLHEMLIGNNVVKFISKLDEPGIWQIDSIGDRLIISDLRPKDWGNWLVKNAFIFYLRRNGREVSLIRYNLANADQKVVHTLSPLVPEGFKSITIDTQLLTLVYSERSHVESDIVSLSADLR